MLNQSAALDLAFQALADPTRRTMIEHLSRGPASVSELARPLDMSLPAVMQHLSVLESAGLVRSRKTGRVRTCQVDPISLSRAEQWINHRRIEWENRLDRLGAYLAQDRPNLPAARDINRPVEQTPDNDPTPQADPGANDQGPATLNTKGGKDGGND